jgi:hypothetical protein
VVWTNHTQLARNPLFLSERHLIKTPSRTVAARGAGTIGTTTAIAELRPLAAISTRLRPLGPVPVGRAVTLGTLRPITVCGTISLRTLRPITICGTISLRTLRPVTIRGTLPLRTLRPVAVGPTLS